MYMNSNFKNIVKTMSRYNKLNKNHLKKVNQTYNLKLQRSTQLHHLQYATKMAVFNISQQTVQVP